METASALGFYYLSIFLSDSLILAAQNPDYTVYNNTLLSNLWHRCGQR
jgi:hypothetical protein